MLEAGWELAIKKNGHTTLVNDIMRLSLTLKWLNEIDLCLEKMRRGLRKNKDEDVRLVYLPKFTYTF